MSWLTHRLQQLQPHRRPYQVHVLAAALGIDPDDPQTLAWRTGLSRSQVTRYRQLGLTEAQADRWATQAGLHPNTVWPHWGAGLPPMGALNAGKTRCPHGHPYTTIDTRGYRVCNTCKRQKTAARRQKTAETQVTQLATQR